MALAAQKMDDTASLFNAPPPDHAAYKIRKPFAHQVIDNFLPADIAEVAHAAFPKPDADIWKTMGRNYKKDKIADKFEMTNYEAMDPALQRVVDIINGPAFVDYLNKLTGFDDLLPDMTLNGGGLNMVKPGGFLRTHADFNWSNDLQSYRTVNALLYMNKGWRQEWGGCLELWEEDMSKIGEVVVPLFNRLAIFTTFHTSFHGYRPIKSPNGQTRNGFNFYFYRKEAAPKIEQNPHATYWRFDDGFDEELTKT
jgi:hypothetical protein